jgi:hypothetical protein
MIAVMHIKFTHASSLNRNKSLLFGLWKFASFYVLNLWAMMSKHHSADHPNNADSWQSLLDMSMCSVLRLEAVLFILCVIVLVTNVFDVIIVVAITIQILVALFRIFIASVRLRCVL